METLNHNFRKPTMTKDWIAGSVGGFALTIAAHPFDTLKIRMQKDLSKSSMLKNIRSCLMNEGILGFYKGMGFPLITVSLLNAIVFSTNEISKIYFGYVNEDSLIEGTITGAIAGLVNSFLVTPVELVKCRLQVQTEDKKVSRYKGILDCLKQVYIEKGIKGVYQGNIITIMREIPGYGTQFGSYYYLKYIIASLNNQNVKELNDLSLMTAGAFSGVICWVFSYPQDVIKTNIQLDIDGTIFRNKRCFDGGLISCVKYIYHREGFRGFWVGFLPQSLQAIVGNAILFLIYEKLKIILFKL